MAEYRTLIVNADDYGLTAGVSAGIRLAHQTGVVTSTTAMMNFPRACLEIRRALEDCPDLGLGVHLVASAGAPVRPAAKVASLVQGGGLFLPYRAWTPAHWDAVDAVQLADEWQAQIDLFIEAAGRAPTHLDSHHHLSYLHPKPAEIMLTLADSLGVPVRNPQGLTDWTPQLGEGEGRTVPVLAGMGDRWRRGRHPSGLISNYLGTGRTVADTVVKALPPGAIIEAMCHPGQVDDDLRGLSSYADDRARELDILCQPALRTHLSERGIVLASFAVYQV